MRDFLYKFIFLIGVFSNTHQLYASSECARIVSLISDDLHLEELSHEKIPTTMEFLNRVFAYDSKNPLLIDLPRRLKEGIENRRAGAEKPDQYWILWDKKNQKIVGAIGLGAVWENPPEERWWIDWFGIDPEWRGRKLGTKLLGFAVEFIHQMKETHLNLYTSELPEEADAQFLYDKFQFVEYRRFEDVAADGRKYTAFLKVKKIPN